MIAPLVLGERFSVAPGARVDAPFELTVPPGIPPSVPGERDYVLTAWAIAQGHWIDSVCDVPLWIAPQGSAAAAAPTAAWLRPGASAIALGEGGTEPVLVVEVRGAVTLVQWSGARPATWVRTDTLRPA